MAVGAEVEISVTDAQVRVAPVRGLKAWWRRGREFFPLTWLGLFTLSACYGLWRYAADKQDHVLNGAALMGLTLVLGMVALVVLVTPVVAARVGKRESGLPEALHSQQEVISDFRPLASAWLPLLELSHEVTFPPGVKVRLVRDQGGWQEFLTFSERGYYGDFERRFEVRDIFGFARIQWRKRWAVAVRVKPELGQTQVELSIQKASDEGFSHPSGQPMGELVDMRRYGPGDPMRHILWKVFARSGKLMVREPERAIAPRPTMVGFFVAGEGDEASAATARLFLERNLLGPDFLFGADGAASLTSDSKEALEQVIRSRAYRSEQAGALGSLIKSLDRGRQENLVLFAPASEGAWVERLAQVARSLHVRPTVLLSVDSAQKVQPRTRMQRWLSASDEPSRQGLKGAAAVASKLTQAGMKVEVVVRDSGEVLRQSQLEAWREAQ